ncbi:O-acyltransferase like protein-like [Cydia fagiglandana]|uniref:O-acyltransferase like protein-like n=1 Tax=Cydia fagiglandana TaxID=1458189 RepID=UPI002FEDEC88
MTQGNFVDLGYYQQCLAISENFEPSDIEGKYCMINVPLVQDELNLPVLPEWPEGSVRSGDWPNLPWQQPHSDIFRNLQKVRTEAAKYSRMPGPDGTDFMRVTEDSPMANEVFRLAVCLPKACTPRQFLDTVFINTTSVGLQLTEEYCRLRNDKPFAPVDYAAILLTFNSVPGTLESLDGIRSISMLWVIIFHTYATNGNTHLFNRQELFTWMYSFSALWFVASPISVDTFFLLSGLLIVYTTVGKITPKGLLKNIHMFYLHRLLRMFPILATAVFLQASLFNHLSDGPEWHIVVDKVERCRAYWWATLTYVQNYLVHARCIGPSWYLAVDMQLHILSPFILFWMLGRKRSAWIALTLVILVVMVVSTTYNYLNKFQTASRSQEDAIHYLRYYYHNTLTRCSPFFVGMLFGYLLNMYKSKQVHMARWFVALCWFCAFVVSTGIIYSSYPVLQMDWDSPFWDGIINSFARPGWAVCVGWVVFACTHGYGGPVNWFLSLRMWKLPSRLSYAMYIFHYSFMVVVNSTSVSVGHFSVERFFYRFLADFVTAFIVAFVATVLIDYPFATLVKMAIGGSKTGKATAKTKTRM